MSTIVLVSHTAIMTVNVLSDEKTFVPIPVLHSFYRVLRARGQIVILPDSRKDDTLLIDGTTGNVVTIPHDVARRSLPMIVGMDLFLTEANYFAGHDFETRGLLTMVMPEKKDFICGSSRYFVLRDPSSVILLFDRVSKEMRPIISAPCTASLTNVAIVGNELWTMEVSYDKGTVRLFSYSLATESTRKTTPDWEFNLGQASARYMMVPVHPHFLLILPHVLVLKSHSRHFGYHFHLFDTIERAGVTIDDCFNEDLPDAKPYDVHYILAMQTL